VLDGVLRTLGEVEARWPEIERACGSKPRALVHCDFSERNVRIRDEGSQSRLLAFDWEVAGWGLPAVDLIGVDLSTYAESVRADWPGVDRAALERFAQLGQLLRGGVVAASWAARSLGTAYPDDAVHELSIYERKIGNALAALGLRAAPEPP
jgi:aminoglycoside phosphotransferase (APT) family kinase protein